MRRKLIKKSAIIMSRRDCLYFYDSTREMTKRIETSKNFETFRALVGWNRERVELRFGLMFKTSSPWSTPGGDIYSFRQYRQGAWCD